MEIKKIDDFLSMPPINSVAFIKKFMEMETICNTKWAEKSKMENIDVCAIIDAEREVE